jgi:hypothetical protein
MMAAEYAQIPGAANSLGRHYSGFPAKPPGQAIAHQSLAAAKFLAHMPNRQSQVRLRWPSYSCIAEK